MLDEAEAAGLFRVPVQAHYYLFHRACPGTQLDDLRLRRVERQVSYVYSFAIGQRLDLVLVGREELAVDVYFLGVRSFVMPERRARAQSSRFREGRGLVLLAGVDVHALVIAGINLTRRRRARRRASGARQGGSAGNWGPQGWWRRTRGVAEEQCACARVIPCAAA